MQNNIHANQDKGNNSQQVEQFLDLLLANHHRIYAYILSRVPRLADADDLMQETTTLMWRKYDQFTPGTNFVAWGKTIAHFHILKYRKARPPHCQLSPEAAEAIGTDSEKMIHEFHDRLSALKKCMKKLNENDRRVVQMRYEWGIAVKDIAQRTGEPVYKIYRTLTRMHEALMRCVRRTLAEEAVS